MLKFCFRIRTRGGMVVDNLLVTALDRADAERKVARIYHHCEFLEGHEAPAQPPMDAPELSLENAIALITREADPQLPSKRTT